MNAFARGARVVVLDHPHSAGLAGRKALVIEPSHADSPEAAVLSFEDAPGIVGLLPNSREVLAPFEDRPCLSLDPRCCFFAPCDACLSLLREHMSEALRAGKMTAEQGAGFVGRWNELRGEVRQKMAETLRQAREWHAAHAPAAAIEMTPPPAPQEPTTSDQEPEPQEPEPQDPAEPPPEPAAEVVEPLPQSSQPEPPPEPDSPQVSPVEVVEKNVDESRVTPRRAKRKKDVPSASAPKTRAEGDPESEEGAASSVSGASGEAAIDIPSTRSEPS